MKENLRKKMKYGIYNLKTRKFEKNPFDKGTLVFEYPIQAMKFIKKYFKSKDFTIQKLT